MGLAQVYGMLGVATYIAYLNILEKITNGSTFNNPDFDSSLIYTFSLVGAFGFYYGRSSVLRFFWMQTSILYRTVELREIDSKELISRFKTLE